jgi:hypothetical protein
MKLPNWALPLVIIAFVAIRIFVASRFRKAERQRSGKGPRTTVPVWLKVFWAALALAVVILLIWNPRRAAPVEPPSAAQQTPHP